MLSSALFLTLTLTLTLTFYLVKVQYNDLSCMLTDVGY